MAMYRVPKVVNQMRHVDGAPLGTRGGASVVHQFPADGDYTFKLALYYDFLETLYGQSLPSNLQGQQIEVSVDGARAAALHHQPEHPRDEDGSHDAGRARDGGAAPRLGGVHREVRRSDRG